MSGEARQLAPTSSSSPHVSLSRIRQINTYEVMETDLMNLQTAGDREQTALAFLTFCAGVLIPTLISWATAAELTAQASGVYAGISSMFGLATMYFLVTWLRESKVRPVLLQQIRERAGRIEEIAEVPMPKVTSSLGP